MKLYKNVSKQIFVANLVLGADYGKHPLCQSTTIKRSRVVEHDGERGVVIEDREIPAAVTWLAGDVLELPDAVANVPEVRAMIMAGKMLVTSPEMPAAKAATVKHDEDDADSSSDVVA